MLTKTALAATILALVAADDPEPANYKDDVAPIFRARCNACHNNDKKKGGLVLENFAALMQGGASGVVVEPGDPDNSRLYLLVNHDEEPTMPPNSPKIADAEIDAIRRWIAAGAPEASGAVVAVKAKPKLEMAIDPEAMGRPRGEPAMPSGLATNPVVLSNRPPAVGALAASPWAPLIAIGGHKQVLLYETEGPRLVGVLPFPEGRVATLKFTGDGELLLAGGGRGGQSGRVVVWDVKTGERAIEVGDEYDTVLAADISPDRSLIALGGPSRVLRVYNTSDGTLAYECKKHTEWVTAAAFSPDGVLLASGDRNGGLVVWEATTGREFYDLRGHAGSITDVSWRPDSNMLASASEDTSIRLWEMQGGGNAKTWNAHGGPQSIRFAKDGRLVSAGRDRTAIVWGADGAQQAQLPGFPDVALQAVFTADDKGVVASDASGEVRLIDPAVGTTLATFAANPEPVAVRLSKLVGTLAEARSAVEAADSEIQVLRAGAETQAKAIEALRAELAAAEEAAATASATLTETVSASEKLRARADRLEAERRALAAEAANGTASAPKESTGGS